MMSAIWDSFVAVLQKEFLHIRRNRATFIVAITIPIFQLTLFGFIDQNVKNIPTVIVDQDGTSHGRVLMDKLRATGTFSIKRITADPRQAREDIAAGRAKVGIVIPSSFHGRRARDAAAEVLVFIDGSDSNVSTGVLASINGLAASENVRALAAKAHAPSIGHAAALSVHPIILFNPDGRTANFLIPGLVAILLQLVAIVLASTSIVRERERGTLDQLLVTPIHPVGLMLGKLAPYLLVSLADMIVILAAMRFGFAVAIRGSLLFLFSMAVVYLFALLSMGLFISVRASTQMQAQQMAQFFFLPSVFLSGYIFPVAGLPVALQWAGKVLPATHMVEIMRGVVLRDAGLRELLPNVLALFAISAVWVALSVRRFRKGPLQ